MNTLKALKPCKPCRSAVPPGKDELLLAGLNLLRLLVQNRIAEFHTELELLPHEVPTPPLGPRPQARSALAPAREQFLRLWPQRCDILARRQQTRKKWLASVGICALEAVMLSHPFGAHLLFHPWLWLLL